ncbi:WXG100 family type VII secretion target [Demequina activiva]|uniref:WXG100 family type VII secretion target n=1 Tax=Demequina activiva TaxID=1582364 RepID=A0A919Q3Y3_9MICO|nr:WXG100 family type VII secretion target [Demequina activiva]GIG53853.1 hypothetical protein Dac01nite_06050 [Demequina activiva]
MAEHAFDTAELRSLARELDDLAAFLERFQSQTNSHGQALLSSWSGRASQEFIAEVAVWAAGATALQQRASVLAEWAHGAEATYDTAVEQAKGVVGS